MLTDACRKQNQAAHLPLLERLASDKRMKSVWNTIYKQEAASPEKGEQRKFMYPADVSALFFERIPPRLEMAMLGIHLGSGFDEEARALRKEVEQTRRAQLNLLYEQKHDHLFQNAAACSVFDEAFFIAAMKPEVFTRQSIVERQKRLKEVGDQLMAIANEGSTLGFNHDQIKSLKMVAFDAYVRNENEPSHASMLTVGRQRTDARVRAFVILMTFVCRRLLGTSLNGVVSTLANVTLRRSDLNAEKVQKMVRGSKLDWSDL